MPDNVSQINCTPTGNGPPVIMIHGNPATHTLWRPLAERVAAVRTVYAIDLPGFGASPPPREHAGYGLEALAASVLAFADAHGIERFDLVGHSFGGATAITIASLAPERLRSLVAITPMTDRIPPLAHLLRLPGVEPIASSCWRIAPGGVRRWIVRNWTHVSYGRGFSRERSVEVAREADRGDLVKSLIGLMTEANYAALGRAIARVAANGALPLLLIGAGDDRVIPYSHFQSIRKRMARAACHIFPSGGHVVMWQYPDEVAEMVVRFWSESGVRSRKSGVL